MTKNSRLPIDYILYCFFRFDSSTNLKLSVCQPVFVAPAAKLIKNFHQRLSTFGQRILYLGRNLRILLSHNELICFQFFEITTKGLIPLTLECKVVEDKMEIYGHHVIGEKVGQAWHIADEKIKIYQNTHCCRNPCSSL